MLDVHRHGGGQPPAGLGRTGEHVGQRRHPSPGRRTSTGAPRRTSSAHDRSIGDAALTTTTVRGLAAATRRISSSWRPGRDRSARSWPSVSHSPLVADEHEGHVRAGRRLDRPLHQAVVAGRKPTRTRRSSPGAGSTRPRAPPARRPRGGPPDEVLARHAPHVGAAGRRRIGDAVEHAPPVEQHPGVADLRQREGRRSPPRAARRCPDARTTTRRPAARRSGTPSSAARSGGAPRAPRRRAPGRRRARPRTRRAPGAPSGPAAWPTG